MDAKNRFARLWNNGTCIDNNDFISPGRLRRSAHPDVGPLDKRQGPACGPFSSGPTARAALLKLPKILFYFIGIHIPKARYTISRRRPLSACRKRPRLAKQAKVLDAELLTASARDPSRGLPPTFSFLSASWNF
jgi:hypothetical protein